MREKEKSTTIIYVRHGKTDFPENRIYCDDVEDPELNALGTNQAKALEKFFQEKKVDLMYVSPAKRTRMTAEGIARATKAPILVSEALKERHFGIFEGFTFSEIEKKYSVEFKKWKEDPARFKPERGESIDDLRERVKNIISEILSQNSGKTVVISSHVGPIRMAVVDALQIPVRLYRQICIDCASVTRIDYGKSQNNFIYMNRIP